LIKELGGRHRASDVRIPLVVVTEPYSIALTGSLEKLDLHAKAPSSVTRSSAKNRVV
jgi:hypothetical protein